MLASLSGTCRIILQGKKVAKEFNGDVKWDIRIPTEDDKSNFMKLRKEKLERERRVAEQANFATADLKGEQPSHIVQGDAVGDTPQPSQLPPIANQPHPRSLEHVCDVSTAACRALSDNNPVVRTNPIYSSRSATPEGLRIEQMV